ncbi:MAG: hypothetical protein KAV82_09765 [Phycisphaerae bacterium]|nr:hypothetical protein [Phycisphaerae bacterium]
MDGQTHVMTRPAFVLHRALLVLVPLICCPVVVADSSHILVSEIFDPAGDASPAYCDIVAARVWQVDALHYQLDIEVAGEIPILPDPEDYIRFMWYLAGGLGNGWHGPPAGEIRHTRLEKAIHFGKMLSKARQRETLGVAVD